MTLLSIQVTVHFFASQAAQEVMYVSESVSQATGKDFNGVILVSDDTNSIILPDSVTLMTEMGKA